MKGLGITFVIFGILNLIVGISAAAYGEAEAAGRKFGGRRHVDCPWCFYDFQSQEEKGGRTE